MNDTIEAVEVDITSWWVFYDIARSLVGREHIAFALAPTPR